MSRGTATHRQLEDNFYRIMNMIDSKNWKQFARIQLRLAGYQIDDIEADNARDIREQKYQMLSLWQRRNGRKATLQKLEELVSDFNTSRRPQGVVAQNIGRPEALTHDTQRGRPESDAPAYPSHSDTLVGHTESPRIAAQYPDEERPVHSNHDSLPEPHAYNSLQSNNCSLQNGGHMGQEREVHSDRSIACRQIDSNETTPKSISQPIHHGVGNIKMQAKPIPQAMGQFMPGMMNTSNIQINVIGHHAKGIENNTYYVVNQPKQKITWPRTENNQDFIPYCSKVTERNVQFCSEESYEKHFRNLDSIYKITRKPKGVVLLINNSFPREMDERHGSNGDVRNMEMLWKELGCQVFLKTEITAAETMDALSKFVSLRKTCASDFVVVIVMSHGGRVKEEDIFYGAQREVVKVKEMLELFNNENAHRLQGIPKLFFFQICRGNDVDLGVEAIDEEIETSFTSLRTTVRETSCHIPTGDQSDASGTPTTRKPTMSDTMVSFATQAGYRAFRNSEEGSWYTNAIANVFMRHAKDEHVLDMMTKVNNAVAGKTAHNPDDRVIHGGKAMSDFTSTLTKKLFLFPGFPQDYEDDF